MPTSTGTSFSSAHLGAELPLLLALPGSTPLTCICPGPNTFVTPARARGRLVPADRRGRALPGVAGGGRGLPSAARCVGVEAPFPPFMSYANPRCVGRPGSGQRRPGGRRVRPRCPGSRSGWDIGARSGMPCRWPCPIAPGQGYGGLRMTGSVSGRGVVLAPGRSRATSTRLPSQYTRSPAAENWITMWRTRRSGLAREALPLQFHIAGPHRGVGSSPAAAQAASASSHTVDRPMLTRRRCHVGDKTPKRPPKPKKPKPPKPVA